MTDRDLAARFSRLKLLLLDVDGVLTDGRLRYGPHGDEGREFHVRDGTGIKIAQQAGIEVGVLSGREVAAVAHRARELGMTEIVQGRREKAPAWDEILARRGLRDDEVAFMGDDVVDLPVLRRAGIAAAPRDAVAEVLAVAHWTSARVGGDGCVRDLVEAMLRSRGDWDAALDRSLHGHGVDERLGPA